MRGADAAGAYRIASSAFAQGMTLPELCQRVITPALHEIGRLWQEGALTVADEHLATALTHRVLAALRPAVRVDATSGEQKAVAKKRVLLAAIEGEQHALGLRMAADVLEDAGFHPLYLGADVPTDALVQAVAVLSPDLVALSATLPELGSRLEEVAGAVCKAHPRVGLIIGGQAATAQGMEVALVQNLEQLPGRVTGSPRV